MSVADIAPVLRKTQTHVKVLLFRARQALGRELRAARRPGLAGVDAASRRAPDREATSTPVREEGGGRSVGRLIGCPGALVSSGLSGVRKGSV